MMCMMEDGDAPHIEGKRYILYGERGLHEAFWSSHWNRWVQSARVNYDGYPEDGYRQIYMPEEVKAWMEADDAAI